VISIDRSSVAEPQSLVVDGPKERAEAIAFFDRQANRTKSYVFKVYGKPDVRDALNHLFHEKCAYCESSYRATAPVDVEHYRPKGAIVINGKKEKPGYYWLAASWDNLLPSCIDCNRARTQRFEGEEDDSEVREVGGKENQFPLADELLRGRDPDAEAGEEPARLLLNPCKDHPERHLEFLPNGLVRAKRRSRRGAASIKVYALRRKGLKEERLARLLRLAEQMDDILFLAERHEKTPGDAGLKARLDLQLGRLEGEMDATEPYAGLARQFISAFQASLRDGTCRSFVHDFLTSVTSATPSQSPGPPSEP
jgi:hypothetical protein